MVSYYNHPFAMYPKNHSGGGNLPYSASTSAWYSNYHHQQPNAAQFIDTDAPPQHMYHYPAHMLPPQPSPDWVGHDNYTSSPQNGSLLQGSGGVGAGGGGIGNGPGSAAFLSLNQATQNGANNEHCNDALPNLPSPPATVHSGSDMSSPGATGPSSSPQIPSRPTPVKSPYEWMKKPSYQSQPNPGKKNSQFYFISIFIFMCWCQDHPIILFTCVSITSLLFLLFVAQKDLQSSSIFCIPKNQNKKKLNLRNPRLIYDSKIHSELFLKDS